MENSQWDLIWLSFSSLVFTVLFLERSLFEFSFLYLPLLWFFPSPGKIMSSDFLLLWRLLLSELSASLLVGMILLKIIWIFSWHSLRNLLVLLELALLRSLCFPASSLLFSFYCLVSSFDCPSLCPFVPGFPFPLHSLQLPESFKLYIPCLYRGLTRDLGTPN